SRRPRERKVSGDRRRPHHDRTQRRRRSLLHRRRGVDFAARRSLRETDRSPRHYSKPGRDRDEGSDLARHCASAGEIAWRMPSLRPINATRWLAMTASIEYIIAFSLEVPAIPRHPFPQDIPNKEPQKWSFAPAG